MKNVEAEAKWLARLRAAGTVVEGLAAGQGCKALEKGEMREVRILLTSPERGDVLMVLKAFAAGSKYVAFVGGPDAVTALLAWRAKEQGAGVKWRLDEWVGGQAGGVG